MDKQRVCPVMEMLTSTHDATSIGTWLSKFKYFAITNKSKWPLFGKVVVDFSFALINAVLMYWNYMRDVRGCLSLCFDVICNKSILPTDVITLHICCCHFMKIIANDVKKHFANKIIKVFYKEVLASAFQISNIDVMEAWFEQLCFVALTPSMNEQVSQKLEFLVSLCEGNEIVEETEREDADLHVSDDFPTVYESSPFYQKMLAVKIKVDELVDKSVTNNANPYFCPDFIILTLKKYMAYLPLWSGLMSSGERQSNAPVENWFGLVKNNILDGQTNLKPSRFVRKVRAKILSLYREIVYQKNVKRCASQKLALRPEHSEETWKRKQKRAHTYFEQTVIKKGKLNLKNRQQVFDVPTIVVNKLKFYENGLVADEGYYVKLPQNYIYFISEYNDYNGSINKLQIQDFECIKFNQESELGMYLNNFVIDIALHLFTRKKRDMFSTISAESTSSLTNGKRVESHITIYGKCIAPVNVDNNHWRLLYADTVKKEFCLLDPFGDNLRITEKTMHIFLKTLGLPADEWQAITLNHDRQRDSYNCGVNTAVCEKNYRR